MIATKHRIVTGVAGKHVIPGTGEQPGVTAAPVDDIIPVASADCVVPAEPTQEVVTGSAFNVLLESRPARQGVLGIGQNERPPDLELCVEVIEMKTECCYEGLVDRLTICQLFG